METIQLPWPLSVLDEPTLNIKAKLDAVCEAVKAVPTENKDLVRRAVEGSVAIMQKIAAREDFEGSHSDTYTKPQFRKLCNVLAKADLADDIAIKETVQLLAGNIATMGMTAVTKVAGIIRIPILIGC